MKTKTGKVVCRSDYIVSLRIRVDIPIIAHFSVLSSNPGLKNKFKAWRRRVRWDDTYRLVGSVVYGKVFDILSNDNQILVQKLAGDRGSLLEKALIEVNKSLEKYRLRADCLEVKDEK